MMMIVSIQLSLELLSHCYYSRRMPRTSHRGRKKVALEPSEEYLRLDHHKQLICWNYFVQFAATQGKEGWDPAEAGSVYHYRSSSYIQSLGSGSWF